MYQPFENQGKEEEILKYSNSQWFSRLNFAKTYFKLCGKLKTDTSVEHLPDPTLPENCSKRARNIMSHIINKRTPFISFVRQFKCQILVSCFLVLIDFTIKILNSILMGTIIRYLTTQKDELQDQYSHQTVFGAFFTLLFVGIYPRLWTFQYCNSFGAKLRFTITHLVHMKVNMVSSFQLQKYGAGKLMNLISNDLNDLQSGLIWVIQLFLLPITLSIGTYALWRAFGWYSVCGIIVLVISLKIQDTITKSVKAPLQQKNKIADKRILFSKEFIKNIKTIKMYVMQKKLIDIINQLRTKEIGFNFNVMLNQGISKLLSYSSIMITILAMVIFRLMLEEHNLHKQSIYAAIGILGVIRGTNFNGGLNYFTIIRIISERIQSFLNLKILPQRKISPIEYISSVSSEVEIERIAMNARLKLPEYKTQKSSQDIYLFKNKDKSLVGSLNLKVHNRVFISGESGSGKTAVVEAFLKQSQFYTVENLKGRLAYVPQEPVLFNGTVRSNITFGKVYIHEKFQQVVRLCELSKDMLIFPQGAETKVVMQGASFSGGQRSRIGIARALYSDADIFLMDNCLSALDPAVRKKIHRNLFGQKFKDKIIIFSTSDDSEILDQSFLIKMQNQTIEWFNVFEPQVRSKSKSTIQLPAEQKLAQSIVSPPPPSPVEQLLEQSDKGKITKDTYLHYIKHLGTDYKGFIKGLVIITLFVLCQFSALGFYKNLPQLGTNTWTTLKLVGNYITMYFCLDYLRTYVMVVLASTNSVQTHKDLIKNVGYAKYEWYSKRQSELTNVFANHVGIVDRPLPNILYDVVKGLLSNLVYIINLCIVTPAFIPIATVLAICLWTVKHFLQKYIRKCKMLQLKYRSPVYNKLAQHFSGVVLVRNYGVQKQFEQEFATTAYESQKTYFSFLEINRFLDLILEFILFLMIVLGVTLTLIFSANSSNSNLALSMFTLINMTSDLSFIIRQTITVELNLISLQKLRSYNSIPVESVNEDIQKHAYIPIPKGEIVFENVKMKYPGASSFCLNGINLTINQGQKVAIMGRTGAGKSSIFLALYRLYDLQPGSVIKVGGVDISSVDLYTLRKNWLSCSAQDALRLPPLTSSASPTQLKFQSIVNENRTIIKLLDEPFANIDDNLQKKIWQHINSLSTVLSVVHSGDLTKWSRIITLQDGEILSDSGPSPPQISQLRKSMLLSSKTDKMQSKKQQKQQQKIQNEQKESMLKSEFVTQDHIQIQESQQSAQVQTPDRLISDVDFQHQQNSQSILALRE